MSKKDKLLLKLLRRPKDFTWQELIRLLKSLGYEPVKNRKNRRFKKAIYSRHCSANNSS